MSYYDTVHALYERIGVIRDGRRQSAGRCSSWTLMGQEKRREQQDAADEDEVDRGGN